MPSISLGEFAVSFSFPASSLKGWLYQPVSSSQLPMMVGTTSVPISQTQKLKDKRWSYFQGHAAGQ